MTNEEMAVAVLRMLRDYHPKDRCVVAELEFSTIYHNPEIKIFHFNDARAITKYEQYAEHVKCVVSERADYVGGSFEEGFKRLEELVDGQK